MDTYWGKLQPPTFWSILIRRTSRVKIQDTSSWNPCYHFDNQYEHEENLHRKSTHWTHDLEPIVWFVGGHPLLLHYSSEDTFQLIHGGPQVLEICVGFTYFPKEHLRFLLGFTCLSRVVLVQVIHQSKTPVFPSAFSLCGGWSESQILEKSSNTFISQDWFLSERPGAQERV